MLTPSGAPDPPEVVHSVRVRTQGVQARKAIVVAVGTLGLIVALGLTGGPEGHEPRSSVVAIHSPTAPSTSAPTPVTAAATPAPFVSDPPCAEVGPTGSTPLPDIAGALPGDDSGGALPLGTVTSVPNDDRLDFLVKGPECSRDAHWIDPQDPGMGTGAWTAGRPFHVREGFINNGRQELGDGFDVVLYVTRFAEFVPGQTYRYTPDYVLRGTSDRCGPTYRIQSGPETCEWFVHDFPDGLPEGRFAIWAVWEAPCEAWLELGFENDCSEPDGAISLFASGFDAPYQLAGPTYTELAGY